MKSEFVFGAVKIAAQAVAASMASAAGSAAMAGSGPTHVGIAAALLFVAGVCAVSGALFYQSKETEHPARDTAITVVFPFLSGVGGGGFVGHYVMTHVPGADGLYRTALAEHIVGGLVIGVFLTPALRRASAWIDKIGGGQ